MPFNDEINVNKLRLKCLNGQCPKYLWTLFKKLDYFSMTYSSKYSREPIAAPALALLH